MKYTIKKLADLAGISTRTLRYYDKIGLLAPEGLNESGYRIYGEQEVDALQQILFYKNLGLELSEIKESLAAPGFDRVAILKGQLKKLRIRQQELTLLINNVENTIKKEKGLMKMTDIEKFAGLKKQMIEENERDYGEEIRTKYGDKLVDESNAKIMNLSEAEYQKMKQLGEKINCILEKAVKENADPAGPVGKEIFSLHKEWLCFSWNQYSGEAHRGLAEIYVADERFKKYYDENVDGCAAFIRDAIKIYAAQ